jgi:hypothetical protein
LGKDVFQNRFVPSTIRSVKERENAGTAPEKGTLHKDTFMSVVPAKGVEAPVPRRNRFLSNEKTGSRQSCDCNASIANNRYLQRYQYHGENIWLFKIDDTIEVRERCTRPSVRTAKRSAKFLSNPGKIVQCIAGTAFPSIKIAVDKKMFLDREFV